MIEIEMRLFGAFRKYQQKSVFLKLEAPASVDQVKIALAKRLAEVSPAFGKNEEKLIQDSAIANDQEILLPHLMLHQSCCLSILPPVCGG